MSSPGARQRRRRQQYQSPRSRAEIATAIGASVGIVGTTALMIWLLRPGGLADRQPRSSWLIGGSIIAALSAVYALRPASRLKVNRKIAMPGALGGILLVAVVLGVVWPGGLLRHTPKLPPVITTPTTPLTSPPSTAGGGSTTTAAGGSTTAPSSTATSGSTTIPSNSTTTSKGP